MVTSQAIEPMQNIIPQKVIKFKRDAYSLIHKNREQIKKRYSSIKRRGLFFVKYGDTFNFCTDMEMVDYTCIEYKKATARKVVKSIDTKQGVKNLVIWVEDSEYNDGSLFLNGTITQSMVDKLANKFLQNSDNNGYDNDIYDWDTNIFGAEWGDSAKSIDSNLIANNNTIDILIYNMNQENLAGYFWSKDNFTQTKIPASNEKIMFYINSQLYIKDEKETFATLAHEFQHMIHFYQRAVLKAIKDETWFDEMMSEATEDLMATKLKYKGARNVDYKDGSAGSLDNYGGPSRRYPAFNRYNSIPLTYWSGSYVDYGKVNAFGAFLLRNYGGAKVLHDMMYSNSKNEKAILDATKQKDFKDLLSRWAEAVILSDIDNLDNSKPKYNFGDFKEITYNNITYKLGSINFFNYTIQPKFTYSEILYKNGIMYYKLGSNLSGDIKIKVNIPIGADVTIIAK